MTVGVFGKLPARRDYVQHGVEPRLLRLIDPWLQRAVAGSREVLGDAWLDNYLLAPIWRFWLGPRLPGRPVLGALMPSVDGVGRYFPLCALGAFDAPLPTPELDDQPEWFAAVEALLLAALAEGGSYEALLAGLDALPRPRSEPGPPEEGAAIRAALAALRQPGPDAPPDCLTFWWVPSPGADAAPPRALIGRGMPEPHDYAAMLVSEGQQALSPAPGAAG